MTENVERRRELQIRARRKIKGESKDGMIREEK